ncbi:MAG: DUF1538 domain-containing protein [Christensenellales bacterium]|jgi:hypothetical protein
MIERWFNGYLDVVLETLLLLAPILVIGGVAQVLFLRLSKRKLLTMLKGILLAFIGLTIFLQGVNVGFIPVGKALGEQFAALPYNWILLPIGFILGFAVTLAEPSVQVLVEQIEKVTGGFLRKKLMLATLCIGVGISITLFMLKLLLGLSLWVFIVPGYIIALLLTLITPQDFTSIAFDSGGVATGTMTATFLLSLAIGVANQLEGTDSLLDGFGLIALVALTPILLVLILGLIYKWKTKKLEQLAHQAKEVNDD